MSNQKKEEKTAQEKENKTFSLNVVIVVGIVCIGSAIYMFMFF